MFSRCQSILSRSHGAPRSWNTSWLVSAARQHSTPASQLPSEADVVIIGGGVIGCSTLYHLQKQGINAILLEKDLITSGTTWHSAGLLWRLRPNDTEIKLIDHTRELVKTDGILAQETDGQSCGWNSNGGLFIARTQQRLDEYKRLQTIGKFFGIDSHVLSPSETQELYPLMDVSDIAGTLFSPGDGTVEPSDYVQTLARACKSLGGKIFEHTAVSGFETTPCASPVAPGSRGSGLTSPSHAISGVRLACGHLIHTRKLAICGGIWTRDVCKLFESSGAGRAVQAPLCAMRHAYVLTDAIEGMRRMPCVRDHDLSMYLRVQGSALQVGGYEPNPMFERPEPEFAFGLYELDWDVFARHLEHGAQRVPIIGETGLRTEVCGPESFTPDHKPLLGAVPEVKNVFLGAGFNSAGVMLSGGCGRELAGLMAQGRFESDMFGYDVRRFHSDLAHRDEWIKERSHESYAKNYSIVFPQDEPLAGRNKHLGRRGHAHEVLLRQGCVFQERHGFERAGWFNNEFAQKSDALQKYYESVLNISGAAAGEEAGAEWDDVDAWNEGLSAAVKEYDYYGAYVEASVDEGQCEPDMMMEAHEDYNYRDCLDLEYTFDFARNHDVIGQEAKQCRNGVVVFDQSYFGKFVLTGKDADRAIEYICTNVVAQKPVGSTVYTHMCNDAGRVECDLGVSKIDEGIYYITAGGGSCSHDFAHISGVIQEQGFACELRDDSAHFSMFSVQGPKSRELLEMCLEGGENGIKLDNEAFPFGTNQVGCMVYGGRRFEGIRMIRLTFVGELGWELHVPAECAKEVYCLLFRLGRELGVQPAGYRAIDSLSCEKGYLHWHEDVGTDDTPLESGVAFVVNKKLKDATQDFKGKQALLEQSEMGLKKKLVHVRLAPEAEKKRLHGLETIWRNGVCVGYLRRASFDYSEDVAIGTGYLVNREGNNVVDNVYIQGSKKQGIAKPNYEIEVMGEKYPCLVSTKALFDPKSERVQGNYAAKMQLQKE